MGVKLGVLRTLPCLLGLLAAASSLYAQSSSFQPSFQITQFPTGCPSSTASAIAIAGDFNGDHITDLVVGCITSDQGFFSQISVLLGKGDGTFQPPVVTAINTTITSALPEIMAADVNGDGKVDLVFSDGNFRVIVLLSNGDGTFALPNTLETSLSYYSVYRVADLRGNGITDIILTSAVQAGFAVTLGKGDGTFGPPTIYSLPSGQVADPVAIADFNGDGKPDVITTDYVSFSIWLNKGDGKDT